MNPRPALDITRLMTLRALAHSGTMTAAAEILHLTPSAVSQQLSLLERETGMLLTERRGRGVTLTPAGNMLVAHTERIMNVLEEANASLEQLRNDIVGELRVAAFSSVAVTLLPDTVRALRAAFPRLQVIIEEKEPQESLTALHTWQIDIALVDDLAVTLEDAKARYEFIPLAVDALHVLLPANHKLAQRSSLALTDLRHEQWALDSTSSSFGHFITTLCQRAGFTPYINTHCAGFEMVAAMVASGCSISVVSGLRLAGRQLPGVSAVRLEPEVQRKIMFAHRKGGQQHPAIQAFVQEAKKIAGSTLG